MKAQMWREEKIGEAPAKTFDQAALRFLRHYEGQADYDSKVGHITYWRTKFGGRLLPDITADKVEEERPTHQVMNSGKTKLLAPATKNRYVATLRTMLNMCVGWGWLAQTPDFQMLDEPKKHIRWITQEEARALLDAIAMDWMRDVAAFALATGARMREVLDLRWSQVNAPQRIAWLEADQTKSGRARSVPLSDDALAVIRRRIGQHQKLVFTRVGSPLPSIDRRMFYKACDDVGIENFRFHDLRHTWASWHVQAGTPLMVLKELGGWETIEMVQKYAHLGPSHLAAHANVVTFWSQLPVFGAEEVKTPLVRAALSS